jgi:LysM repeat protein
MKNHPVALLILVFLVLSLALPVQAQSTSSTTVSYTVQPGDTVYKIARQHCTNWYEVYQMNRHIIGANPNVLKPGMVLTVPNRCDGDQPNPTSTPTSTPTPKPTSKPTSKPPDHTVYDRGPSPHAQGPVYGNLYLVVYGDTMYSISRRFGLTVSQLSSANGISNPWRIYAGQRLVIPGLGQPTTPTPPPPSQSFITITSPTSGSVLPPTFTVSGTGGGLFEGNVVVQALDDKGQTLAEKATTLQGPNVGTGGSGTWTVELTVNVPDGTPGQIIALSPESSVSSRVSITYGTQPAQPFIQISTPSPGVLLPPTFTVGGTGGGLFEGNVVVRAVNNLGQTLAEQPTTLQGPDVGAGGSGTWSVQLTVNVSAQTPGIIYALSPGSAVSDKVEVIFGVSGTDYVTFAPGQCRIQAKANTPLYASPDGSVTGQVGPEGGTFDALRGTISNSQRWYSISPEANMGNPEQWLPITGLLTLTTGCIW